MGLSQGSIRTGLQGLDLKAWVLFNGTTGAIVKQFNVSGVVRTGVGAYTVSFAANLATTNYVCPMDSVAARRLSGSNKNPHVCITSGSVGSCTVVVADAAGGTASDADFVYVEFYE